MSRRKKDYLLEDLIKYFALVFVLVIGGFIVKNKEMIKSYSYVALSLTLVVAAIAIGFLILWKRKAKQNYIDYEDENKILGMLRGISPQDFEKEIAGMFSRLGYKTKHVGHTHDGGLDVTAEKDGDNYLIQCKRYNERSSVGVKDIREFNGVVSAHLAKGLFITTNEFTPEAKAEFEQYPRIEFIDRWKLVKYYKTSLKKHIEEAPVSKCPRCGGDLILRTAKTGGYTGKNFYGCSNYPKCEYIKPIKPESVDSVST
jgi:restriction system protein